MLKGLGRLGVWYLAATLGVIVAQFEYHEIDAFDQIDSLFKLVNLDNCFIKPSRDLFLPTETVSHLPDIRQLNIDPIFPNRTNILHLHNMAHSRAFFFSYILQSRFKRPAVNISDSASEYDPGLMYYFLSTMADVAANPKINASAMYFQPNMAYSSSYKGFFNKTMPLFAPRAFRMDDYNDPVHLERISTLNFFQVEDLGAILPKGQRSLNYTLEDYRINEWYYSWLPYANRQQDELTTYQVKIRYANNTNETYVFHGPNAPDEDPGPVKFTRPYFDCGRSNKWSFPAITPVADLHPRHTQFRHIEYPTLTAISVMELDFERIDINQCPRGEGNSGPNSFADTSRCKKDTTECEPLDGYGFRRGGYQCRCKPGFRLPNVVRRPYLGEMVERATRYQYSTAFSCTPIGWIQKLPFDYNKMDEYERQQYLSQDYHNVTGAASLRASTINVEEVIEFLKSVTAENCHTFAPDDLILPGDVGFGKESQFENEARMALRLANFLSAFLQIVDHSEIFSGVRVVDRPLTEDQMMGEVLSLILGNSKIWASGMYWDRGKFTNRTLFAPLAYKTTLNTRKFEMEDLARLNSTRDAYVNKPWFRKLKTRWSTNFDDLEKYWLKLKLRHNATGMYSRKYERYPTFYKAAEIHHGQWSVPEFDCTGVVKKWIVHYTAPFFGWDALRAKLEFKGAVRVTMELLNLDIVQCPNEYYVQNAFKDTHRCDRKTSYCVPIQGRGFDTGGYKCECIQGFEYPFEDPITYYDGQLVEAEYLNIIRNKKTRYDFLKCRVAGAAGVQSSFIITLALLLFTLVFRR
ncbi:hypothetical protein Pcinc_018813 [Petrolisthes cinctipes]|uniref:GPR158/179 extracellular domain-containing protein n=1 Tax=Petrolisthes cinctipes TaxID=88211 RepID=A0AAE1FMF0_PETCI|nr:hypothetical protein Pcinc_018813 [Petrolisthes cinctipes]